jgi:TetR/AcrR family transcriptional regulator, transcriptional repressor for nem operon
MITEWEFEDTNMPKTATRETPDTKSRLIDAGMAVMFEKGYTNTGIQEVLSSVGVPKGSFYHYFDSKEDFAIKIIARVEENYAGLLDGYFLDSSLTPLNRLRKYFEEKTVAMQEQRCSRGCLIGTLSQEMADQSEVLRVELARVMQRWRNKYAACIEEGQTIGEINKQLSPQTVAEALLCGWEGAIMRSKTQKTVEPMEAFVKVMFDHVLRPR